MRGLSLYTLLARVKLFSACYNYSATPTKGTNMIHKIIYFTPGGHELFMLVEATSYTVIERAVEFLEAQGNTIDTYYPLSAEQE